MSIISESSRPRQRRIVWLCVVTSALLATLSFPPANLSWLAWLSLTPLISTLLTASTAGRAARRCYVFGVAHWGGVVIWLGPTVCNWAHTPFGWAGWLVLTLILSLWYALFGWASHRLVRGCSAPMRAAGIAAIWVCVEWLRGQTITAVPWALIGYTQYRGILLIQAVSVAGLYVISFAIVWTCATGTELLHLWLSNRRADQGQLAPEEGDIDSPARPGVATVRPQNIRLIAGPSTMVVLLICYGLVTATVPPAQRKLNLAVMQPNIRSDRSVAGSAEADLRACTAQALDLPPYGLDAVFWPETIAPRDAVNDPFTRSVFTQMAVRLHATVVVGTNYQDSVGRIYNSAAAFNRNGLLERRYDKRWLVPMGEWVPLRGLLPFGSVFRFPDDTTAGTSDVPVPVGNAKVGMLICYESVFPSLARAAANRGADMLVLLTNDSWAGRSPELEQHLAMTVFRAVETRRSLAVAATTGITCLIQPNGSISRIAPYRVGALTAAAGLYTTRSLYTRFGDWFVVAAGLFVLYAAFGRRRGSDSNL